ncbi:uncharacterized protein PgNI_00654 [Pyricularia grisea]|uniref:Uncharacterized protein n=1 Tax=Pyricularia grisea TaxID=148305 RepID=A0A6P8BML1_PYRGI|nr:uncharacterized protein PgNI_00654 [Pyricularia grisea]TLD17752.1 hypothetical protein PgNI_00654 [Pyricularia grisea]
MKISAVILALVSVAAAVSIKLSPGGGGDSERVHGRAVEHDKNPALDH